MHYLETTDHFTNQRQSMMTICILCKSTFLVVNLNRRRLVNLSGVCRFYQDYIQDSVSNRMIPRR
jgi:hypothetical protein